MRSICQSGYECMYANECNASPLYRTANITIMGIIQKMNCCQYFCVDILVNDSILSLGARFHNAVLFAAEETTPGIKGVSEYECRRLSG